MDLRQLRYVVALDEHRSFTAAAAALGVTQSMVSHHVARLERELGVELFARTPRRVVPTPAGEALLPEARAAVAAAERAIVAARGADGVVAGTVRIGAIPSVTAVDVAVLLAAVRARYPQVVVHLTVGPSDGHLAALAAGRIDLALLGLTPEETPTGVRAVELLHDRHVAVVAPGHRFAGAGPFSMADLATEPFVDFPLGSPARRQSDRAAAAAGVERRIDYEVDSVEFLCSLVAAGLGVGLLSPGVADRHPEVVAVEVSDGPQRREWLVWSDFNPSVACRTIVDMITRRDF